MVIRKFARRIAPVGAIVLCLGFSLSAQVAVVDRTRSVEDQALMEQRFSSSLTEHAVALRKFSVVFIGQSAFKAPFFEIEVAPLSRTVFAAFLKRDLQKRREDLRHQLCGVFGTAWPEPAEVTSVPEILERAGADSLPAIVLTDGRNEADSPEDVVTDAALHVVLFPAVGDGTNDFAAFRQRSDNIGNWAPNAIVYPFFRLDEAVRAWVDTAPGAIARRLTLPDDTGLVPAEQCDAQVYGHTGR